MTLAVVTFWMVSEITEGSVKIRGEEGRKIVIFSHSPLLPLFRERLS